MNGSVQLFYLFIWRTVAHCHSLWNATEHSNRNIPLTVPPTRHTSYRNASAIQWRDNYIYQSGSTSSTKGLEFNYADPDEGFYMWKPDKRAGPEAAESSIMMTVRGEKMCKGTLIR